MGCDEQREGMDASPSKDYVLLFILFIKHINGAPVVPALLARFRRRSPTGGWPAAEKKSAASSTHLTRTGDAAHLHP